MKTVHLVPRSTGFFANNAFSANSSAEYPRDAAKFSIKEPHPEEHASFSMMLSTTPFFRRIHFISCPPISNTQSTFGSKNEAASQCAIVSTSPSSRPNAFFKRFSPYPVEQERTIFAVFGISFFNFLIPSIAV